MTINVELRGSFAKYSSQPATTAEATLFTANEENPVVAQLILCNPDSSGRKATVKYNDGSTDYTLFDETIAANSTEIKDVFLPLFDGESVKITSPDAGSTIVFNAIVVEIGSPVRE